MTKSALTVAGIFVTENGATNMAILTDKILSKDFMPNGFDQKDGYRAYKYIALEK